MSNESIVKESPNEDMRRMLQHAEQEVKRLTERLAALTNVEADYKALKKAHNELRLEKTALLVLLGVFQQSITHLYAAGDSPLLTSEDYVKIAMSSISDLRDLLDVKELAPPVAVTPKPAKKGARRGK